MINKEGLTKRRKEILECIIEFINKNHRPPLIKEIASELGLTDPTISSHLDKLEENGYVKRQNGQGIMVKETPPYSEYMIVWKRLMRRALKVLEGTEDDEESREIVIDNIKSRLKDVY